jgi:hypothetical protein
VTACRRRATPRPGTAGGSNRVLPARDVAAILRCVNMALCCGQARRRAGFPGHAGSGGPGRLPGFAQRLLPAALTRAVVTQPVGAGTVFHGSAGLAAFT